MAEPDPNARIMPLICVSSYFHGTGSHTSQFHVQQMLC
jgi:hypothetical protein